MTEPASNVVNIAPLMTLRPWQQTAMELVTRHRFTILAVHRRAGKTWLCLLILIYSAIAAKDPSARFAYIAPTMKLAKDIAWPVAKELLRDFPNVVFRDQAGTITFPNGAEISMLAPVDEMVRGKKFQGIVGDEVGFWNNSSDAYGSIIRPTLSDTGGFFVGISTVNGIDPFFEMHQRGLDPKFKDWASLKFDVNQTGALPPEEIEAIKLEQTPEQFAREFLCDFQAAAAGARMLPLPDLLAASKRNADPRVSLSNTPIVMGVDMNGGGGSDSNDKSAYAIRQGNVFHEVGYLPDGNSIDVAGAILGICRRYDDHHHGVDLIAIDATGGYGNGVLDQLHNLDHHYAVGINFASRAAYQPEIYGNRRAELYGRLADLLRKGNLVLPDNQELIRDLSSIERMTDATMKTRLSPKALVKQKIGHSPDLGDAACLTMAQDLSNIERRLTDPILSSYANSFQEINGRRPIFDASMAYDAAAWDSGTPTSSYDYDPFD